jgi:hypothetical protein
VRNVSFFSTLTSNKEKDLLPFFKEGALPLVSFVNGCGDGSSDEVVFNFAVEVISF